MRFFTNFINLKLINLKLMLSWGKIMFIHPFLAIVGMEKLN